jgi:Fe-Mn family superoxide dismutase
MGMFGTGYVWLVMDGVDNLAVVGTYGSGTVLVQGSVHRAKQIELDELASLSESDSSADSNAGIATSSSTSILGQTRSYHSSAVLKSDFPQRAAQFDQMSKPNAFQNLLGSEGMGSSSRASVAPKSSDLERFQSIHPLLCLSLHPHVYIPDYGIWGKEEYIRNFWRNVDWQLAYKRYQAVRELKQQQPVGRVYGGRQ